MGLCLFHIKLPIILCLLLIVNLNWLILCQIICMRNSIVGAMENDAYLIWLISFHQMDSLDTVHALVESTTLL